MSTKVRAPRTAPAAAPAAAAPAVQATYTLSQAAQALATTAAPRHTLQAVQPKGNGLAWRQAGHKAPNTRAAALAAVMGACGAAFTLAQAQAALQAAQATGLNLGTGSPRSYAVAFAKCGYFAPVASA